MKGIGFFTFLLIGLCACQQPTSEENALLSYVDPFIGTGAHGHTFPGAATPYGGVQLSPDTHLLGWEASSGYHYEDSIIYGFSHTHLSGTGIGDLGDILILPYAGATHDSLKAYFRKEKEQASPGYYAVAFDNFPVKAELTASSRVGVHRYSFEGKTPKIMVDLGHILQANWGHKSMEGSLEVLDSHTLRGSRVSSGWAYEHSVFFYAQFSEPFEVESVTQEGRTFAEAPYEGNAIKAFLTFHTESPILIKVGISSVDEEGAKQNLEKEVPHWDFEKVLHETEKAWQKELEKVEVVSSDPQQLTTFYTALYHTLLAPILHQDVDGRYRGMDKKIYQAKEGYTNYTVFSLWDTFRAWGPLMSLIDRERMASWLEGLLQKAKEGGVLPKWPLASNYTGTMVGYPSAALYADAIEKGIGDFARPEVLEALVFASQFDPQFTLPEPRGAGVKSKHLHFIEELGYVPADSLSGSVSYGLECSYYDWCIAQIAQKIGNDSLAARYTERAQYYRNYFNPHSRFMEGKLSGNRWKEGFSPFQSDFNGDFIEGNSWQWSWFVPHDIPGFITLQGGKEQMTQLLDSLFSASGELEGEHIPGDLTGLIGQYAHGNEPSHHVAYLYAHLDQAHQTQEQVSFILNEFYTDKPDGIIGNEDCGQMSAWYVLSALGIYQVCPGDPTFTLGRPWFEQATLHLENGKEFTILAQNLSPENRYVHAVSLNGQAIDKPFISYFDLMNGGELIFDMSSTPQ